MKETSFGNLLERAKNIRYFFTDVDGTLTDGGVYYSPEGEFVKKFSMRDGTGFFLLRHCGIKTGIITSENSPIVTCRAEKLRVDKYIYGSIAKVDAMQSFLKTESLSFENIAYIGDEINDLKLMKKCGLSFAVADADERVKKVANIVCSNKGGCGAFREASEILITILGYNIEQIVEDSL